MRRKIRRNRQLAPGTDCETKEEMHSGGGSNNNVVSVAPATPMMKNMIGIAALVLEGRERSAELGTGGIGGSNKSKDTTAAISMSAARNLIATSAGASTSAAASLLYMPLDAAVPAELTTTTGNNNTASSSMTAWAQNNRFAHIYRLKNRLQQHHSPNQHQTQQSQAQQQRSSPVPSVDYEEEAFAAASGGVYDPLHHLTNARSCRMTTPRSFMNVHLMGPRNASVSSNSSQGSSTSGCGSSASASVVATAPEMMIGRRNSRSSPVPVIMATRTHCDDFLRTIGLLKGGGGGVVADGRGVNVAVPGGSNLKKVPGVVEDESHYCDEAVNVECFRWQQFLRKIETLLCRGSSLCIEVSLGPEAHPLLLEQWVIQRVDRPSSQPSMSIQSLCSAIRSQLHFSQISAWSDLLEQQYTDYAFYQEHILNNPRITMNWATNRPKLDLLYRVKCGTQKCQFERAPVVHNFPTVIVDAATGIAVSLRSLPRLEKIPRLSVENRKSDMMEATVVESEILPNPMAVMQQQQQQQHGVCCQEKGKHRCLTFDELQKQKTQLPGFQESSQVVVGKAGGSRSTNSGSNSSSGGSSQGGGGGGSSMVGLSHRERQLMKYKKRLLKRDKGGGRTGDGEVNLTKQPQLMDGGEENETFPASSSGNEQKKKLTTTTTVGKSSSPTRINDLRLPLYTDVALEVVERKQEKTEHEEEEKENHSQDESLEQQKKKIEAQQLVIMNCQDVATQTDLQLSIDDEVVEMEVDLEESEEEEDHAMDCLESMEMVGTQLSGVTSCKDCNNQMRLVCMNCCGERRQKLREKYRNALVEKKKQSMTTTATGGGSTGSRVFYKIPKGHRVARKLVAAALATMRRGAMRTDDVTENSGGGAATDGQEGASGVSIEGQRDGSGGSVEKEGGKRHLEWNLIAKEPAEQEEDNNNVASVENRNVPRDEDELGKTKNKKKKREREGKKGPQHLTEECESCCPANGVKRDLQERSSSNSQFFLHDESSLDQLLSNAIAAEKRAHHTPTMAEQQQCRGAAGKGIKMPRGSDEVEEENETKQSLESSHNNLKLQKREHATMSLKQQQQQQKTERRADDVAGNLMKSSVHCIKNLTSIFTSATAAAGMMMLDKPPTPQVVLKRLNLLPPNSSSSMMDMLRRKDKEAKGTQEQESVEVEMLEDHSEVFNFELKGKEVEQKGRMEADEDEESKWPQFPSGVKKSLSTPSAWTGGDEKAATASPTPNSLSPRFLKSASVYHKKQRRSRHLSDRSSERSSVCSDELSLSDDETLLLTPNGSNLLLTAGSPLLMGPVMPGRAIGVDGKVVGNGGRSLFKAAFGHRPLLGSIEESLLQRRLTPKFLVSGFRVLLGASGSFCPKQLTIPAKTFFYELTGQSQTTPYMSEIRLPRKGYTIPRSGTVQVTLLNPLGTFVHMFVVPYDFRDMPPMANTFIRQRSLMLDDVNAKASGEGTLMVDQMSTDEQMRLLRYVIHLRFQTTRSGRLVLHSDIRMLISRRTDHDTAAAHAKGALESPNELKTITIMPENPRYSTRIERV